MRYQPSTYEVIPPSAHHGPADLMASFTAVKLGLAAGLVLLAAILGIVFAEQAPTMAVTSTLSLTASSDSSSLGGITVGHS